MMRPATRRSTGRGAVASLESDRRIVPRHPALRIHFDEAGDITE